MISAKDVFHQLTSGPGLMDSVCNFIIRPPRSEYEVDDLGPDVFRIGDDGQQRFMRHDFELENMRGLRFSCSWFKPYPAKRVPCVVYCHANCGGRYDGLEALLVLREGFSLFCFDFCGSGMSEGEYISLGFYERQDLAAVMEFLMLKRDEVDGVALWGRSMGAVTAIMYASKDPWIRCIVCDSPFATLRVLINDLVERHGGRTARVIPNAVVQALVERIRKRIMKRASFDIDDLDTVKYARLCQVPSLLFHGSEDDFVTPKHCELVRDAFPIPCLQQYTPGGHNDERDEDIQKVIAAFLHLYLIDKPNGAREMQEMRERQAKASSAASAGGGGEKPPAKAAASTVKASSHAPAVPQVDSSTSPSSSSSITSSGDSEASATTSALRERYCFSEGTAPIAASALMRQAALEEEEEPASDLTAARVTTLGIGENSPVEARKDKGFNLAAAAQPSSSESATSHHGNPTVLKAVSAGGPEVASLPALQSVPHRPLPVFSATEKKKRV